MDNIADFAKNVARATFWFGVSAIVLMMTIMIMIGVIGGEDQTPEQKAASDIADAVKEWNQNPPQYYYVNGEPLN